MLIGAVLVLSPSTLVDNVHLGVAPTWKNFILAIPIGMIAYTGIETISNMAEEAKDEAKTIPVAINRVRIAVFAIYFTLPAVALYALPVTQTADGSYQTLLGLPTEEGGFAGDPILGVVKQIDLGPLQTAGQLYVGLLAATILFIATNAGIIGVSRLVYSMEIHRQVPDQLRRCTPKYRTPWIGILIFGGVAIVTLLPGQATFLGNMYAFGAMLSFTIAHISLIRLRSKERDHPRPYRGPATCRCAGMTFPCSPSSAGSGRPAPSWSSPPSIPLWPRRGSAGWHSGSPSTSSTATGQGLDLTSTHKVAIAQPVVDHEAEYDSVLVHFGDSGYDDQVLGTARKLAARKRRGIHVLVTITVPNSMDIDAPMPEQETLAQSIIEEAKVAGGGRVSGHVERVRAGQAGRRIVEEAVDMRAAAVVMPLPRRVAGASLFGKTLETVLTRATMPGDHRVQPRGLTHETPTAPAMTRSTPAATPRRRLCACRRAACIASLGARRGHPRTEGAWHRRRSMPRTAPRPLCWKTWRSARSSETTSDTGFSNADGCAHCSSYPI